MKLAHGFQNRFFLMKRWIPPHSPMFNVDYIYLPFQPLWRQNTAPPILEQNVGSPKGCTALVMCKLVTPGDATQAWFHFSVLGLDLNT